MPTTVTTKKLAFNAAEQFKESFTEAALTIGYVFVGNHLVYANESSPDSIVDTIVDEKDVWDNMMAAKRITGNDVELVIPKVTWTANTKYRQYDDTIAVSDLLSANVSQNLKPNYVYTSARNVYKCLSNNASANSTVEPTGDYTSSNGNIATADGYIWKYMYNVKPSNKFLADAWIPTPVSTRQLDYSVSDLGVVDGELTTIVVVNRGAGYYHNNVTVTSYATGCTILTLANTTNVVANMAVSGLGIPAQTHISSLDTPNNKISISRAVTANGGGTAANQLSITTRIYIDGDGIGAVATPVLSGSTTGNISKVTITTIGTGYSRANAYVYGTGTGANTANVRCIIAPKFGHAFNPAKELGGSNVMVSSRIGEIDTSENGKISANTSFRQFGVLINPHKYGESSVITNANANSFISQTTDLTVVSGTAFALDEYVYQGTAANNASAYGHVIDQSTNTVKLTHVQGTFLTGLSLTGANSGTSRIVVRGSNPELEPYTGDVLYTENALKTTRTEGQAENIKLIVRF